MNFASDNVFGVSDEILDALRAVNDGPASSYGGDVYTKRAEQLLNETFEREVATFLVTTGTAANSLALAELTPSYRAVLCHPQSHVFGEECGAFEFQSGGAKTLCVGGDDGKIDAAELERFLASAGARSPGQILPTTLSITQATEFGTVYELDHIAAVSQIAHAHGLKVHMDGARFANALVALGCTAAEMTWKAGIDALSFGATKNGALAVDGVLFFDPADAQAFVFRRLRSGQLWSKGRYLGAQICAYLDDDLWLRNALQANRVAARLAQGLEAVDGVRFACEWRTNQLFPLFRRDVHERLQKAGATYYEWSGDGPKGPGAIGENEVLCRLVTSFRATAADADAFIDAASG